MNSIDQVTLSKTASIQDAIQVIDQNRMGIALIIDENGKLVGTITDGDIRRALLKKISLDEPAMRLLPEKPERYRTPLTAHQDASHGDLINLMHEKVVRQIPLLDDDGRVVDLVSMDDLMPDQALPMQAVVMAGGFGKRLQPLTDETPKPMLHVGEKPIMEHIINQLRESGIEKVNVTTHFQPEKIIDHFGNGEKFGVEIDYVSEDSPLGTAGALSLMEKPDAPLLVINGDILTRVDFRALRKFHHKQKADLTVGVRQYDLQIPYGVVQTQGSQVVDLKEKPSYTFFVNAGIYLLEPSTHAYIPQNKQFDMTDLILALLADNRKVASFPIIEYWLDIGKPDDYKRAQEIMKEQG
ncbi:nucleotidyltransferase family protein [Candidatus Sumerlaeota bacterium]|nr:nucleotidyltransferase family protein [Candidatus Sumerlaeota bacterium]